MEEIKIIRSINGKYIYYLKRGKKGECTGCSYNNAHSVCELALDRDLPKNQNCISDDAGPDWLFVKKELAIKDILKSL